MLRDITTQQRTQACLTAVSERRLLVGAKQEADYKYLDVCKKG